MKKVLRAQLTHLIKLSLRKTRVTTLLGPRQIGKTTLARQISKELKFQDVHFFDLEDPTDFDLMANPKLTLSPLSGLIIIDEIQCRPEIFPYLRVKADSLKKNDAILLLGSSSRELLENSSESLAGRVRYIEISGFSILENLPEDRLFERGGFPLSYISKTQKDSFQWRIDYLKSFIERDLKTLGIDLPSQTLRRFLEMLAGYHGQIFNSSEIGKSIGLSHTTVRKYLDILVGTFLIREIKPWSENIIQRQVKQPKIYFRDSGLLQTLLGIHDKKDLYRYPRIGSLWEGFALEETIKQLQINSDDCYFWSLHQNGELDLLWKKFDTKIGFEFKYSDSPKINSTTKKSLELLKLDELYIIYPGDKKVKIDSNVTLVPLSQVKNLTKN